MKRVLMEAVVADYYRGMQHNALCKRHGISRTTLWKWRRREEFKAILKTLRKKWGKDPLVEREIMRILLKNALRGGISPVDKVRMLSWILDHGEDENTLRRAARKILEIVINLS